MPSAIDSAIFAPRANGVVMLRVKMVAKIIDRARTVKDAHPRTINELDAAEDILP
ncbi:hypothetical protein D3C87_1140040 [compost metagenome]